MRPVPLSAFLLVAFSFLSGCEKKEVTLSRIDTFTGGKEKEWVIAENFFSGENVTEIEECYKDDTVIFSKGDEKAEKRIPIYKWKKNAIKCSTIDDDLSLYFTLSGNTIVFGDQDILTTGTGDIWMIDKAESSEIIISQDKGTIDERRLRFIPVKTQTAPTAN